MSSRPKSLRDCVRHFTPAWFAVNMGTGAVSILFHNYPYLANSITFKVFTYIFFFLNLALFIAFNIVSIVRYSLFPEIWGIMIRHPVQSLYLGCYPMGFSTIISVAVGFINQQENFGGSGFLYFLWGCWWVDTVLTFASAFILLHIMMTMQDHTLSRMTTVWILPVVTLIVGASTGGVLAQALLPHSQYHSLATMALSTVMICIGLTLAFMFLTMYLIRLVVYGVPPGPNVMSVFIPLGPMGQGGYCMLLLGQGYKAILPLRNNSPVLTDAATGETIYVICICLAWALWSLGTMWFLYALLALQDQMRETRLTFKLPFWGLIFPNGVYANLTIQLAQQLDINSLRVWGAIYGLFTLLLWLAVFARTLSLTYNGVIFESPCIEEINLAIRVPPHLRHTQDRHEQELMEAGDKEGVRLEVFAGDEKNGKEKEEEERERASSSSV